MKNVFKFLTLGTMLVAFYAIATTSTFAQATLEECTPIYERFKVERTSTDPTVLTAAIATGKEYLSKCSNLEGQEAVRDYITAQIPKIQKKIDDIMLARLEKRFNDSIPAKNWDESFAAGKELLTKNRPYELDLILTLAGIGYDNVTANPPVDKFNGDTISYAKMGLQKINEGKPSTDFGFFQYANKTKECVDGKTNAIGWMNYIIGYTMYVRQKQNKDAVPYIYKSTQTGCETKSFPEAYRLIGAWYLDEAIKINTKRVELIKAASDQDTDETKALLALQKGYADRSIDAYARAYKMASAVKGPVKTYVDALYKKMQELYDFRFSSKDGIDKYISEVMGKPFPDPNTPVTPVVETTTATTPNTSTMPTNTASTATVADTRPRTATTTSTTGVTTDIATAPIPNTAKKTTTKKAPAKKPAKKKGTR